jgi:hypothetical protein
MSLSGSPAAAFVVAPPTSNRAKLRDSTAPVRGGMPLGSPTRRSPDAGQRERRIPVGDMRKIKTKHGRVGRPRSPERTALAHALMLKQDALSRREAARIRALLDTHIRRSDAEEVWAVECARVQRRLNRLVGKLAPAVVTAAPGGSTMVEAALGAGIRQALTDLASDEDVATTVALLAPETAPEVRRSRNLAEARAQHARLQVLRLDLLARVARP